VFHHTSLRDVEAPETRDPLTRESLGSFKISASVSETATSRLSFVSGKILNILVSETWVSGLVSVSAQKVSCTSQHWTSDVNITRGGSEKSRKTVCGLRNDLPRKAIGHKSVSEVDMLSVYSRVLQTYYVIEVTCFIDAIRKWCSLLLTIPAYTYVIQTHYCTVRI